MPRLLGKSPFLLLAFSLWILACPASQSDEDEFNLLNQQVQTLFKQGRYQEAIPLAEKAVELARRVRDAEHSGTVASLNNLASLYSPIAQYNTARLLRLFAVSGCSAPKTFCRIRSASW
jgi:tetratricopeptide (TPR) repeat protein